MKALVIGTSIAVSACAAQAPVQSAATPPSGVASAAARPATSAPEPNLAPLAPTQFQTATGATAEAPSLASPSEATAPPTPTATTPPVPPAPQPAAKQHAGGKSPKEEDAFGPQGLGLSGIGEGGGGRGEGICLCGDPGPHAVSFAPTIRVGEVRVKGKLPREVVQRIVRGQYGKARLCYESALKRTPRLAGTVTVTFVINESGDVVDPSNAGATVDDAEMVTCLVKTLVGLHFPAPEQGQAEVVYPWRFEPPPESKRSSGHH